MPTHFGFVGKTDETSALGGETIRCIAGAALLLGDAVFVSATPSTVNKSITAGDRLKRVGIVVDPNPVNAVRSATDVTNGVAAAALNGFVHVCYSGVAYGIVGSAITAGAQVMFSAATAGRLIPATPTTDAGKIVGVALEDNSTAGAAIKILVSPS